MSGLLKFNEKLKGRLTQKDKIEPLSNCFK